MGLRFVPPLILLHGESAACGAALGSKLCPRFMRRLGVLLFLLPQQFLPPAGQGFCNPGGNQQRLAHSAVQDIIDSI
jgi:hypothetical protein